MIHDASPSWSGFNYQGKVALYHTLRLINSKPKKNWSDYALRLEHTEDFEIIRSTKILTIHQVKAYKKQSFSSYKNALLSMTLELHKGRRTSGYIHSWKEINPEAGLTIPGSISKCMAKILSEYVGSADPESSIIMKAAGTSISIPKPSSIIRNSFPNALPHEIANIFHEIISKKSNALSRIHCYKYPSGNVCCDLDVIDNKIKTEINKGMTNFSNPTTVGIEHAFHHFLGIIDAHICKKHLTLSSGSPLEIKFPDIISVLKTDFEASSDQYLSFQFKSVFLRTFEDYFEYCEESSEPEIDSGIICHLRKIQESLCKMAPEELWTLYKNCSPHLALESANNFINAMYIDPDGITKALHHIFSRIDSKYFDLTGLRKRFTYRSSQSPMNSYLPTTIRSDLKPPEIAKRILKNPQMIDALYEVGSIIHIGAFSAKFSDLVNDRMVVPDSKGDEEKEKRSDIIKTLRLIAIADAMKELNDV
jgi:hypothetical protein